MFIDRDNTLWVGTWGGGLCQFNSLNTSGNINVTTYNSSNGFSDVIFTITQFDSDDIFVGTQREGMYRMSEQRIDHYDLSIGNTFGTVNVITKDVHGNMWLGAWYEGGVCITNEQNPAHDKRITLTKKDGLAGKNVSSIVEDREGNM